MILEALMKEKIMIVEDEKNLRRVMADFLKASDFIVIEKENGQCALDYLEVNQEIACIILDVMMPIKDGWSTLRAIKADYPHIPVIMLTARNQVDDEVFALELGADDFIGKPFVAARLIARVKTLLKHQRTTQHEIFKYQDLSYDLMALKMSIHGEGIDLTPKEHELFQYLLANENIALSRESLLNHVWGYDYFGDERTVDTHIKRLRMKLKDYGELIKTVRGLGYRFEV
jgi:DNA-binding response OmpR family regulator